MEPSKTTDGILNVVIMMIVFFVTGKRENKYREQLAIFICNLTFSQRSAQKRATQRNKKRGILKTVFPFQLKEKCYVWKMY